MADDPVAFTAEQRKLFHDIADVVRSHPQDFSEAGQWLDALVTSRQGDEQPRLDIIKAAAYTLLSHPPIFERLQPDVAARQARRVLLVVWVLTDPRPLATKPGITELQAWRWGIEYLSDDPIPFTADGKLDWNAPGEININRLFASITLLDPRLDEWVTLADGAKRNAGLPTDQPPKVVGEQQGPAVGARAGDVRLSGERQDVPPTATHSADFTEVNWFGTRYTFDDGLQAKAIGCLWAEFEKAELGLSEKTIGEAVGSANDNYRLIHTFRVKTKTRARKTPKMQMHPAWEVMIQKVGAGVYRLVKPPIPR